MKISLSVALLLCLSSARAALIKQKLVQATALQVASPLSLPKEVLL